MQRTAKKYHKNSIGVCWKVANLQNVGFTFKRKIHTQPQLMIQQICNHKNLFVFLRIETDEKVGNANEIIKNHIDYGSYRKNLFQSPGTDRPLCG